jgi:hypothetical protein
MTIDEVVGISERRKEERRKEKNSFLFYHEYIIFFDMLDDIQVANLIRSLFQFATTKEKKTNLDDKIQIIYNFIVERMKKDQISYDIRCEAQKENIKKRWENKN